MNSSVHNFGDKLHSVKFVISKEENFDFASGEYRGLYDHADCTAFQHPNWLMAFYRKLVPNRRAKALVICGREPETCKLLFVLPMISRKIRGIRIVESADLGVSDYSAPVVRNDAMRALQADRELPSRIRSAIGKFDLLRIKPIRQEMRKNWNVFFKTPPYALEFSSHASTLEAPHDQWRISAYGKSYAKYIDRKARRFEKNFAVTLDILPPNEVDEAISFVQEQRAGRFEGDPIQQEFVREFYSGVAKCCGENGVARTYQLSADGQRVGVIFGLTDGKRYYYLLIGCNYDEYGKHSPGLIMYDRIMADWLNEGGEVFDFTIGDEPFKAQFGAQPTPIYEILQAGSLLGRMVRASYFLRKKLVQKTGSVEA